MIKTIRLSDFREVTKDLPGHATITIGLAPGRDTTSFCSPAVLIDDGTHVTWSEDLKIVTIYGGEVEPKHWQIGPDKEHLLFNGASFEHDADWA